MYGNRVSRSYKDISLSFDPHPITKDLPVLKNANAIRRSVRNLVQTIPGERLFIIDSKDPVDSYQDALKAKDERTYKLALDNHVKKVQGHINELSKKKYSNNKTNKGVVLDGVIMFIPIEGALAMALA